MFNNKITLEPHSGDRRGHFFYDELKKHNITLTQVQVPTNTINRMYTTIDAIGVDANGHSIVIELKTTQLSIEHHLSIYDHVLETMPTLTNGKPNSLKWRHKLQVGFGMLATNIAKGAIITCGCDGAHTEFVGSDASDVNNFALPETYTLLPANSQHKNRKSKRFHRFAESEPTTNILRRVGLTKLVKNNGYDAIYTTNDGRMTAYVGIILANPRYEMSKTLMVAKRTLKSKTKHLKSSIKRAYIISIWKGNWSLEEL